MTGRTKIIEIERAKNGEYLWRYKAANGKKISWSGETYQNRQQAITMAQTGSPVMMIQLHIANANENTEGKAWIYNDETDEYEEIKAKYIDNFDADNPEDHVEDGDEKEE